VAFNGARRSWQIHVSANCRIHEAVGKSNREPNFGREGGLSHFVRAFFSAVALLLTLSFCRAEPNCDDAAVLELYAEAVKCQEIAHCAGDVINGTSRDLAKMSDAELQQRSLRSVFNNARQTSRDLPHFDKWVTFTAGVMSSSLIAWRDAFPTMKASAAPVDYDPDLRRHTCHGRFGFDPPLLSEAIRRYSRLIALVEPKTEMLVSKMIAQNENPESTLKEMAKSTEAKLAKCFNTNRIFYLQSTTANEFSLKLDKNKVAPGCWIG
jgi:hypothetical protein